MNKHERAFWIVEASSYDTDAFPAKWDTAGNLQWVRQVGSNDTDLGMAVTVDAAGAPHLVGGFKGRLLGNKRLSRSSRSEDDSNGKEIFRDEILFPIDARLADMLSKTGRLSAVHWNNFDTHLVTLSIRISPKFAVVPSPIAR